MFKKAKRANFRRRNESDEEDHEEKQQQQLQPPPPLASTLFGPVVDEIPFMETCAGGSLAAAGNADNHLSNGFLANAAPSKTVKKVKKGKEAPAVPVPAKASLLSFDDEEGNFTHRS